jgi:Arc/MetJ-type ribon-helix-helix transcriptional regulator
MTIQLVSRVPDELVTAVDGLVEAGVYESRSDAVRAGLVTVIDHQRRTATGKAIAAGYQRLPQAPDDLGWSDSASAAMIAEEPW